MYDLFSAIIYNLYQVFSEGFSKVASRLEELVHSEKDLAISFNFFLYISSQFFIVNASMALIFPGLFYFNI